MINHTTRTGGSTSSRSRSDRFLHRDNLANISQREVGNDTLSFNAALRHVLRQAPDVGS